MKITKADVGRSAYTREGTRVKITGYVRSDDIYPVRAQWPDGSTEEYVVDGRYYMSDESDEDIVAWEDKDRAIQLIAFQMYNDYNIKVTGCNTIIKFKDFINPQNAGDRSIHEVWVSAATTAYNNGYLPPEDKEGSLEKLTEELYGVLFGSTEYYTENKNTNSASYQIAKRAAEYFLEKTEEN